MIDFIARNLIPGAIKRKIIDEFLISMEDIKIQKIRRMLSSGYNMVQIGEHFDVPPNTIKCWLGIKPCPCEACTTADGGQYPQER